MSSAYFTRSEHWQNKLSIVKCKEEAALKRIGKVEMWAGAKWTHRPVHGSERCCGHREGIETDSHTREPAQGRGIRITCDFENQRSQIS